MELIDPTKNPCYIPWLNSSPFPVVLRDNKLLEKNGGGRERKTI